MQNNLNNTNESFSIGSSPETNVNKAPNPRPTPNPANRKRKKKSKGVIIAQRVGRILIRALAFIGTFIVAALLVVLIALKMICSDRFPSAQQMFVTTVLETGNFKFLASIFLSPEEIQAIVDSNSMKELNADVDSDLIQIGGSGSIDMGGNGGSEQKDIEIIEISGATYTGTMMIVKDPSRISLATIYPWRELGVNLDQLVNDNGAIAGINGGLYASTNNTGGRPYGVVVSNGEIQHNQPQEFPGLVLVGFTNEHILQIIDVSKMNSKDVENMVKEKGIRDAVCFQEESSDANNHFVQLIINNEVREMNGMGSGLNPRTAIGQRADGSVLMFVTDGRGKSGHLGASSGDLIAVMQQYGAVNAANLDGGSSSCMYYNGEYLKSSVTFYYENSSWRLPAGFIVK